MKRITISTCLEALLIILFGCATPQRTIVKQAALQDVTLTASLRKQNDMPGPMPLHLRIENGRSEEVGAGWWEKCTDISVTDTTGKKVSRTEAGRDSFDYLRPRITAVEQANGPRPRALVPAGHSLETTLDLQQYFQLVPGSYSAKVTVVVWLHSGALRLTIPAIPFRVVSGRNEAGSQ